MNKGVNTGLLKLTKKWIIHTWKWINIGEVNWRKEERRQIEPKYRKGKKKKKKKRNGKQTISSKRRRKQLKWNKPIFFSRLGLVDNIVGPAVESVPGLRLILASRCGALWAESSASTFCKSLSSPPLPTLFLLPVSLSRVLCCFQTETRLFPVWRTSGSLWSLLRLLSSCSTGKSLFSQVISCKVGQGAVTRSGPLFLLFQSKLLSP